MDPAGTEHRLGVRQPAGQDLLAVLPGQVAQVRLGGQFHVIRGPGQAYRQRRPAGKGFPGRPAQRLSGTRRPVVAGHDPVCRPGHGDLLVPSRRPAWLLARLGNREEGPEAGYRMSMVEGPGPPLQGTKGPRPGPNDPALRWPSAAGLTIR